MAEKIRDTQILESQLKPLIDLANTEYWKAALNILYLNSSVLRFSEEFDIPCLVSASDSYEEIETSVDLLTGKAKNEFFSLVKPIMKAFFPPILGILGEISIEEDDEGYLRERTIVAMFSKFTSDREQALNIQNQLSKLMLDSVFSLADLILIAVIQSLNQIRKGQIYSSIVEEEYEDMIASLNKIGFIEPKIQVSLCPECLNYELTILNYPSLKDNCPKCGSLWVSHILYVFKKTFTQIKSQNFDLPLFISAFLRQQVGFQSPLSELEIYPNAQLSIPSKEKIVEVDVYIPHFKMGLECKLYENPLTTMTVPKISGISGQLKTQIDKYSLAGIKNIIIITNLHETSAKKIQNNLQKIYTDKNDPELKISVIGGKIEDLLKHLISLADIISVELNKIFEERIKKSLPYKNKKGENSFENI